MALSQRALIGFPLHPRCSVLGCFVPISPGRYAACRGQVLPPAWPFEKSRAPVSMTFWLLATKRRPSSATMSTRLLAHSWQAVAASGNERAAVKRDILYVLASHGGFLGLGDKLVAVRWIDLRATEDRQMYVLDVAPKVPGGEVAAIYLAAGVADHKVNCPASQHARQAFFASR